MDAPGAATPAESNQNPTSLKATFERAEALLSTLDGASSTSPQYQQTLATCLQLYSSCVELASRLALFSPNESLDDLSTASLPYLLCEYRIAELIQRQTSDSGPAARAAVVTRARKAYEKFLTLVDSYGLLDNERQGSGGGGGGGGKSSYHAMWERYLENPLGFTVTGSTGPSGLAGAAARRDAKIAAFRTESALRQKLDALRARKQEAVARRQRRRKQNGTTDDGEGDDEEQDLEAAGIDESLARELHLAEIALAIHTTFPSLEALNREAEMLAHVGVEGPPHGIADEARMRRREGEEAAAARRDGSGSSYSERLDPPLGGLQRPFAGSGGPLLSKEGKPLQPFTIVGTRAEIAKGVFRPGHNLPTMTIDEYLEEERRRGGIIEGGGEKSGAQQEVDEDDMERADAETYKQRAWDEFVESNPKGAGNTLNRG